MVEQYAVDVIRDVKPRQQKHSPSVTARELGRTVSAALHQLLSASYACENMTVSASRQISSKKTHMHSRLSAFFPGLPG